MIRPLQRRGGQTAGKGVPAGQHFPEGHLLRDSPVVEEESDLPALAGHVSVGPAQILGADLPPPGASPPAPRTPVSCQGASTVNRIPSSASTSRVSRSAAVSGSHMPSGSRPNSRRKCTLPHRSGSSCRPDPGGEGWRGCRPAPWRCRDPAAPGSDGPPRPEPPRVTGSLRTIQSRRVGTEIEGNMLVVVDYGRDLLVRTENPRRAIRARSIPAGCAHSSCGRGRRRFPGRRARSRDSRGGADRSVRVQRCISRAYCRRQRRFTQDGQSTQNQKGKKRTRTA